MYSALYRLAVGCLLFTATAIVSWGAADDLRLIQAVRSGDASLAAQLLEQGVDANLIQGDGSAALHCASRRDDLAIAEMLIHAGAQAGHANDTGATPLHVACTNRSGAMVELLLAAGADANAKLLNGETVLITCSHTGDTTSVKALLAHGARVNEKESGHDQTALMWAAAQGHSQVVRLLLKAGANFRARSITYSQTVVGEETQRAGREELNYDVLRGGSTPLLFAARAGDTESVRLLLEAGADVNDALSDGTSALVLAAHSGHGKVGIVLLEKGADPNAFGTGYSALHAAVLRNQTVLVRALLSHGADPNARITKGTPMRRQTTDFNLPAPLIGATPYLLAAKFVEAEIMKDLVLGGADPSLAMPDGTTPLMAAAGVGARAGRNRRGIAPIDVGGKLESEDQILAAVRAAVEAGSDVNRADADGNTALHALALNRFDSVVQFLAEQDADVNFKNAQGQTPLAALTRPIGRRGRPARASDEDAAEPVRALTADLLRRLGAVE